MDNGKAAAALCHALGLDGRGVVALSIHFEVGRRTRVEATMLLPELGAHGELAGFEEALQSFELVSTGGTQPTAASSERSAGFAEARPSATSSTARS